MVVTFHLNRLLRMRTRGNYWVQFKLSYKFSNFIKAETTWDPKHCQWNIFGIIDTLRNFNILMVISRPQVSSLKIVKESFSIPWYIENTQVVNRLKATGSCTLRPQEMCTVSRTFCLVKHITAELYRLILWLAEYLAANENAQEQCNASCMCTDTDR